MYRRTILSAAVLMAISHSALAASSTIRITLWDKGASTAMLTDKGIGMTGDATPSPMGLKLSDTTAKAGKVTLKVVNSSKDTIHEMVIFPYQEGGKIPFVENDKKIDEDAAGHLGEVSELDPGKSGTLKIDLKPGKYVLACNIPGHYMSGMWAILTVK